jgi:ABC-type sugar transport system ATPase subunit
MSALIELRAVTRLYGGIPALDNVSLSLPDAPRR